MNEPLAHPETVSERLELGARAWPIHTGAMVAGVAGLVLSILAGYLSRDGFARFYHAYLISYCFVLSICLGGLAFVLLQHLTRAGWSVSVRRGAESLGAMMPVMAALSLPIIVSVLLRGGALYPWAQDTVDHVIAGKRAFLNPTFFVIRLAIYFGVWSAIGIWYWRTSIRQDQTGDVELTTKMQKYAAPAIVALGITLTGAAFDLLMSLDPHWYSTIFGVYFFAGSAVAAFATMILCVYLLQRTGYLLRSISVEHYHDLGKFLFGFVFFWGYIAFSQYMLLWYANIPEETAWLARRGATTVPQDINGWTTVSLMILFGNLLIPFAGLMSRHIKRNKGLLAFWAAWLLVFHWIDLFWLIGPELDGKVHLGVVEIATLVGIVGVSVAALVRIGARHELRPVRDPRLEEALAFHNV